MQREGPVTERTFQLTFTDPESRACGFTSGWTAAAARLSRRAGFGQRRAELTA
jgi:hypothetical protein